MLKKPQKQMNKTIGVFGTGEQLKILAIGLNPNLNPFEP